MDEVTTDQASDAIAHLREVAVLREVIDGFDAAQVARLGSAVQWHNLEGGTELFRQGDVSEDIYVLIAGRLGVSVDRGTGARLVHRTVPGELIGEMALISHESRSATLIAMRDSVVLRIPGSIARELLAGSPPFVAFLLAQLVARLRETTIGNAAPVVLDAVAVVPIDGSEIDDDNARLIASAFTALRGRTTIVDQRDGDTPDPDLSDGTMGIFVARDRTSAWSAHCLRQADRVVFIARAGARPDAYAEATVAALKRQGRSADLMIVNGAGVKFPEGATIWLPLFAPDHIAHVRKGDLADYGRVARLATGQAVGVALAGGGARGFAHIGALRALTEAGIPVDMVCGTSMGAIIGGTYAHDIDLVEVERAIHHSFVLNKPVADYTVPVVSIARGRRMTGLFREHFREARIENCWRNFFCASTNLTTGNLQIHNEGLMWRALRASSSLPGIVPPLVEGGDVLVDGGLINNFPVDTMAALGRGRVIGVDIVVGANFRADEDDMESRSLAWMLGPGRRKVPNIMKLLIRSLTIASEARSVANRRAADLLIQPQLDAVDLLSFDKMESAIASGYQATRRVLDALPTPFI